MKASTVRVIVAMVALAVVAAMVPAGSAALSGITDNPANSFDSADDFVTNPSFRVVTYEIKTAAGFTGTTHLLTLNQNLASDYFVLLRGAAGDYTSGTDRGPDDNYARIDQDPFGNFAAGSSAANQLRLARGGSTGTWTGQVTVVECIADCAASGFRLHRVNEVTMTTGQTSATDLTGPSWGAEGITWIGLYGGSYGGGMETTETGADNHKTGWARIWPSGADTVNLSRSNTGPGAITGTTEFTVYVVNWGYQWTIQKGRIQGSNGGDGMNQTTHYNTGTLPTAVNRADTWVVAYGQVDDNTLAAGWEGHTWTLGDGVNVNATETLVAVGAEVGAQRDVEVYVHTHPDLFNQYVFGPDGTAPGIISGNLSGTVTIQGPKSPEVHNANDTAGRRFPLVANSSNDAGGGGGGGPTIQQTAVGGDDSPADLTLVTDTSLTNVNGDLYVAMIATKPDDKNIVSVTGMNLTWTEDTSLNQCGARGQLEGYVYTATGDGGANGVVTVNLADAPNTSAVVVHRITGQHATAPIQATQTANTNGEGGVCSGGTDTIPWDVDETSLFDDSLLLGFAASKSDKDPYTVDAPWVDIGYKKTIDGGSNVAIQYSSRTTTTAGLYNFGGDWESTVDWTAHWIEVRSSGPAVQAYPRPIVWGQLDADTTARWQRSRSGEPGTYWLQTPDFGDIGSMQYPSFRVTIYDIPFGDFTDTTYSLTLNQDLLPDYFVLMRGAAGNYSSGTDWGPDENYARITQDPFGNFSEVSAANALGFARDSPGSTWTGQVTVVECIADCLASGFTLVRVNEVTMTSGQTSATDTTGAAWGSGNLGQIGLYGGQYGGGIFTDEWGVPNHKTGWARIWPSGSDTVNLSRSDTGPGAITGTTDFSVYVVQWGSEWTIQRANVTGSNGGDGMDMTTHYNTAAISSVNRADTWVIAYGQVDSNTLDAGWEGHSWTLGDGVNQNTTETLVAVGSEAGVQRDVEVYVHTHPKFFNQYVFGPDGVAPGIITGNLSGIATIQNPTSVETHNANDTVGRRFIIVANTQNGAGTSFPRSIAWGHLDFNTGGRWQRSRSGQPGTYWMQTPDFGEIGTFNPTPQFARPDSDIATATWTTAEAAHWHAIDERSADDDTTYTESPTNPANTEDVEFGLRSVTDPSSSTGHIVRYKWRNAVNDIGNAEIDVTIELRQGVTVIASKSHTGIDHLNWISDSFTLSAAEADSITNYSDLRIYFDITFNAGILGDRNARVTWAELEVPGAP